MTGWGEELSDGNGQGKAGGHRQTTVQKTQSHPPRRAINFDQHGVHTGRETRDRRARQGIPGKKGGVVAEEQRVDQHYLAVGKVGGELEPAVKVGLIENRLAPVWKLEPAPKPTRF